jgi:hypothetical protein
MYAYFDNRTTARLKVIEKIVVVLLLVYSYFVSGMSTAFGEGRLTDLFLTKSFSGSWEVMNKFDWMGGIMNFVITFFSALGLFMVLYQRFITMLYLGGKPLWDNVYDMKQESIGGAVFGFGKMFTNIFRASRNTSTGTDSIIALGYSFLPNVKAFSDYNPERPAHNVQEDDTIITYMLKTALPTIMLVFFFTIGFSGTLPKGYGMVVNAMAAVADRATDTNLEAMVTRWAKTGEAYDFTIGENNTPEGEFAQKIASDVYGKVLSRMDILDTPTRMVVGKNVETWVWDNVLGGGYGSDARTKLQGLLNKTGISGDPGQVLNVSSDDDVKALKYDIILNTSTSDAGSSLTVPLSSFLDGVDNTSTTLGASLNAHIIVKKSKPRNADFFVVPDSATDPN